MPEYLDSTGRKRWSELVDELEKMGVLTAVDQEPLGLYCAAYAAFVSATRILKKRGWVMRTPSGYQQQSPWVGIRNRALDDMHKWGPELGIGAASRSRIEVKKKDDDANPLAEILKEAKAEAAARRDKG